MRPLDSLEDSEQSPKVGDTLIVYQPKEKLDPPKADAHQADLPLE